jgi:hypothetical protein
VKRLSSSVLKTKKPWNVVILSKRKRVPNMSLGSNRGLSKLSTSMRRFNSRKNWKVRKI